MRCSECSSRIDKSSQDHPLHCLWFAERPNTCVFFAHGDAPYAVATAPARAGQPACYSCDFARFDAPETARCLAPFPRSEAAPRPVRHECALYLPRTWGHMDCPGCHTELHVVSSERIACESGHTFYLSRGRATLCTGCGAELPPYVYQCQEGTVDTWYKVTLHFCPRCGWGNFQTRYAGPTGARSRGYGGQRWSPRTGRRLTY